MHSLHNQTDIGYVANYKYFSTFALFYVISLETQIHSQPHSCHLPEPAGKAVLGFRDRPHRAERCGRRAVRIIFRAVQFLAHSQYFARFGHHQLQQPPHIAERVEHQPLFFQHLVVKTDTRRGLLCREHAGRMALQLRPLADSDAYAANTQPISVGADTIFPVEHCRFADVQNRQFCFGSRPPGADYCLQSAAVGQHHQ